MTGSGRGYHAASKKTLKESESISQMDTIELAVLGGATVNDKDEKDNLTDP